MAPRYQEITGDGPRYAAETVHASDPEWDWIYQYVRDHPGILTARHAHPVARWSSATQANAPRPKQKADALSAAANAAFNAGDYQAALDLADQGETADPGRARRWEQIRGAIREKAAAAGHAPQPAIPERSAPTAPEARRAPSAAGGGSHRRTRCGGRQRERGRGSRRGRRRPARRVVPAGRPGWPGRERAVP